MPEERLTKNDKRDQAREAARLAREKQKRAESRRRVLIPTGVTVVIVAIAAVVFLVVSTTAPAPQTAAGPKNMISDGILLTGSGGTMVATPTAAIKAKGTPTATKYTSDGLAHIVTYVDFSCPSCKAFEEASSANIKSLVEQGKATLEVHPIAILDTHYLNSKYSTRANNVGACVANFAPDSFYAVMQQLYLDQPTENTDGLTNAQLVREVHTAGLVNGDVDKCITGVTFEPWLTAATSRATRDPLPNDTSGSSVQGTPTIIVNGQPFTGDFSSASAFSAFIDQVLGN